MLVLHFFLFTVFSFFRSLRLYFTSSFHGILSAWAMPWTNALALVTSPSLQNSAVVEQETFLRFATDFHCNNPLHLFSTPPFPKSVSVRLMLWANDPAQFLQSLLQTQKIFGHTQTQAMIRFLLGCIDTLLIYKSMVWSFFIYYFNSKHFISLGLSVLIDLLLLKQKAHKRARCLVKSRKKGGSNKVGKHEVNKRH